MGMGVPASRTKECRRESKEENKQRPRGRRKKRQPKILGKIYKNLQKQMEHHTVNPYKQGFYLFRTWLHPRAWTVSGSQKTFNNIVE
jgi:hypothetical protein